MKETTTSWMVSCSFHLEFPALAVATFDQGPGLAAALTDRALPVAVASGLSFPDTDVAVGSVGGTVTWTPPGNPSGATQFTHYQTLCLRC